MNPSFDVGDDPKEISSALLAYGCVLLRGAIEPEPLLALDRISSDCFTNSAFATSLGYSANEINNAEARGVIASGPIERAALAGQSIVGLLTRSAHIINAILGQRAALNPQFHVRYRDPLKPETALPFHQHPYNMAGIDDPNRSRFLGIVIPFVPFDGTRPDVEFITTAINHMVEITQSPKTQFGAFEIDESKVLMDYENHRWRPRTAVGDVILFREGTLHRSYVEQGMKSRRTSVDLRLCSAEDPLPAFRGTSAILIPEGKQVILPK